MKKLAHFIKLFLPETTKRSVIKHRKAAILVYTHFYVFVTLTVLLLLSKTLVTTSLMAALIAVPCIVFSLYFFKKKGNINLSGNILSVVWFLTLLSILLKTGGIHSCFIPWIYSIIFVMVLVESYIWATAWFCVASISCVGLFIAGRNFPEINVTNFSDLDTLISYLTVGFFMFTNLVVFEKHQVFVITLLKERNNQLKSQKQEIANHFNELEKLQQKLTATNQELQIFAYAASHDLKEPLRMIGMYTQLIKRKLQSNLDSNTEEYMFFVTDGVKRMQQLLDNLLAYSLLGKNQKDAVLIDLNEKIQTVKQNLIVLTQETQAEILCDNLPTIMGSKTEMAQLFQNIIANALKFRKANVKPIINISCLENPREYIISISDNGIGIRAEDQERIFDIFTRLNGHDAYEGTGIGLATCKKILANQNGKIWVSSTEGVGTTFYFTLPKTEIPIANQEKVIQNDLVSNLN